MCILFHSFPSLMVLFSLTRNQRCKIWIRKWYVMLRLVLFFSNLSIMLLIVAVIIREAFFSGKQSTPIYGTRELSQPIATGVLLPEFQLRDRSLFMPRVGTEKKCFFG